MFGVVVLTRDFSLGLILGVIGLATAPAGTVAAIHLSRGRGQLSRMTIAVVGIDDGIGIIYFVFTLSIVKFFLGNDFSIYELITIPFKEIGGAVLIGLVLGGALAYIGKLIKHREDVFIIGISFIFICIGLSELLHASSILACMVLGVIFINFAPRIGRTTKTSIESIIPPIFVLFFAIAGIELGLQYNSLINFGILSMLGIVIVYVVYRILGKIAGAYVAGRTMKAPKKIQNYLGYTLLSQAGVAIGLAILANNELGQYSDAAYLGAIVISVITITTIFFEILGPIGVRYALNKTGEAHDK
jgi:Kef-type K+ transport system membrane component KefB